MTVNPRSALREAIAARTEARAARDGAAQALVRANEVLAEAVSGFERHAASAAAAERSGAADVAAAIRRGERPSVALSDDARAAIRALDESGARRSVADGARDQIASELANAEIAMKAAEASAREAATAVVADEIADVAASIGPAFAKLCGDVDRVLGLARLNVGGTFAALPDALRLTLPGLRVLGDALEGARPQRPGLTPPPDAIAAGRLKDYVAKLLEDPEAVDPTDAPVANASPKRAAA